jgi:YVTN family beta-propeller protein
MRGSHWGSGAARLGGGPASRVEFRRKIAPAVLALAIVGPAILALAWYAGANTTLNAYGTTAATGGSPVAIAYDSGCANTWTANAAPSGYSFFTPAGVVGGALLGTSLRSLAIDAANGDVYIGDSSADMVYVFTCAGGAVATIPTPCPPAALAWDPSSSEIWATCHSSGIAFWVSPGPPVAVGGVLPVTGGTDALAYDANSGDMLIASTAVSSVTAVTSLNTAAWSKAVGAAPVALAYDSATGNMYVVNEAGGSVSVLKPAGGLAGTVTVGSLPVAAVYDVGTGHVFVANSGSGTLTDINGLSVAASVTVGAVPTAVGDDLATSNVYVTNSGAGTVSVVSPGDIVVETFTVGTTPDALTYNGNNFDMWVADTGSPVAANVDELPSTVDTPALAAGSTPFAIAFASGAMYATLPGVNSLEGIGDANSLTGAVLALGPHGCTGPEEIAYSPASGDMYAVCVGSSSVAVTTLVPNWVTTLGGFTNPNSIVYDPANSEMLVGSSSTSKVWPISSTNVVGAAIIVGSQTSPRGMVYDPASSDVFVADTGSNQVSLITSTNTVATTVGVGTGPSAVALDPATNNVWVVCTGSNNVYTLSSTGGFLARTAVPAGSNPDFIAYDPASLSMLVSDPGVNDVSSITTASYTVTNIAMGAGTTPGPMAYDLADGNMYVVDTANSDIGEISATNVLSVTVVTLAATATGGGDMEYSPTNENLYFVDLGANAIWDV